MAATAAMAAAGATALPQLSSLPRPSSASIPRFLPSITSCFVTRNTLPSLRFCIALPAPSQRGLLHINNAIQGAANEKEVDEKKFMEKMEKSLEATRSNFNTVRTGRASPNLLDRVEVEYYGTNVPLKSISQVSTPDGSTILIQPFDKSSLAVIEKALIKSDVGITPSNDGNVIRLIVPQLTADRRKELLKLVSKLTEEGKVAIRNVRRDAIKSFEKLEKDKKISEDSMKDLSNDIQKMTDEYIKKVETLFKQKEKELTTV